MYVGISHTYQSCGCGIKLHWILIFDKLQYVLIAGDSERQAWQHHAVL